MNSLGKHINWDDVGASGGHVFSIDELDGFINHVVENSSDILKKNNFLSPTLTIDVQKSIFYKHKFIIQLEKDDKYTTLNLILEYTNGKASGGIVLNNTNYKTIEEIKEAIDTIEVREKLRKIYYGYFDDIDRDW